MTRRSTFVTVISWIALVWSGYHAAAGVASLVFLSTVTFPASSPVTTAVQTDLGNVLASSRGVAAGITLAYVLACACAAGMLRRREWARKTFIGLLGLAGTAAIVLGLFVEGVLSRVDTPPAPDQLMSELPNLDAVLLASRGFNVAVMLVSVCVCGWLAHRLSSEHIRSEFSSGDGMEMYRSH